MVYSPILQGTLIGFEPIFTEWKSVVYPIYDCCMCLFIFSFLLYIYYIKNFLFFQVGCIYQDNKNFNKILLLLAGA